MARIKNILEGSLWLALLAGAFLFRAPPDAARRPMHCDEAVQAVKFGQLLDEGVYRYDPREYHGPTLYYVTLPFAWAGGARAFSELTEVDVRGVPLVFGLGLLVLLLGARRAMGRIAALAAGALTSVSLFMVFYSQYYIQEMLLVFFTFAAMLFLWRFLKIPRARFALGAGLSAGLMYATKETAAISFLAMGVGLLAVFARRPRAVRAWLSQGAVRRGLLCAGLAAAAVAVLFFSSFFAHGAGPWDSIRAYAHFFVRAGGSGHEKGFGYFFPLLTFHRAGGFWWGEGAVLLLALPALVVAVKGRAPRGADPDAVRFLAVYALALTLIYSLIPYKTPWLLLGALHAFILLAGLGWAWLWEVSPRLPARAVLLALLAVALTFMGRQAWRGTRFYAADPRNPCVYSHTSTDLVRGMKLIEDVAAVSPEGHALTIKVMGSEYWPLPWYLRAYPRVGYWNEVPDRPEAPIMIVAAEWQEALGARLSDPGRYRRTMVGLRPGVIMVIYFRADLWASAMARRAAPE